MSEPKWEEVASPRQDDYTERLRLPNKGWLYRVIVYGENPQAAPAVAVVFVPEEVS